jgi:tetratricopeptide (TPR) repeat protein
VKSELITKEAYKSFKKGSYVIVIQLLEKNITISNNPFDYFLLILSYLFTDKLAQAEALLRKALLQYPAFVPLLEIQAFLMLKAAKSKDDACTGYIDILKISPGNKQITKIIAKIQVSADFEQFQKKAKVKDFINVKPPKKVKISFRAGRPILHFRTVALVLIIIAFLITGIVFFPSSLAKLIQEKIELLFYHPSLKSGEDVSQISLDGMHYDIIDKIQKVRTPEFYASNEACIQDFNQAKWLIKEGKENDAMIVLNKIDASNANFRVKERVAFLKDFINRNRERTVAKFSYRDVIQKPYLYKGINVKWQGKVANYKKKDGISFQLLINYSENRFDGVVEVFAPFSVKALDNGAIVTVEGIITNIVGGKIVIMQATNVEIKTE